MTARCSCARATCATAEAAGNKLGGRKFGASTVEAAYLDPARFAAELRHVFREGALCAGFSTDLGGRPNDYQRYEVAGKSILLTRDEEGRFRAFENCCRHPQLM